MPTLNQTQLDSLQAKITAGNIAGFYAELEGYGDGYGRLGGAVTNNNSWQGLLANGFAASGADDNSVDLSHGSTAWILFKHLLVDNPYWRNNVKTFNAHSFSLNCAVRLR